MRGLHGLPARHGASCLREIPICFFCSQGTVTCYVRHAGGEWPARDELPWVGWSGLQKLRIHTLHTVRYTVPTATNVICSFFFCTAGRGAVGYARDLSCRVSRPDTRTSVLAVSSFSASVCPVGSCRPTRACSRPATLTSSTRPGRSDPFFSPSLRSFCSRVCPAR
jgi:hypothetical protein